jgi:Flp pilus assembly protein TadG
VKNRIQSAKRRGSDERGAAVVEFALAATLLLLLLFGIITYGYVLSFKQGMTQAASEGARAGAVGSLPGPAIDRSVLAFDQHCAPGGPLTCTTTTNACGTHQCITVQLVYDYKNHPLLPTLPGLGLILPDTLTSTRVAEVN